MPEHVNQDPIRCRRLLNAGSGSREISRLPASLRTPEWEEITVDVDPVNRPDHVCSLTDMRQAFPDGSIDVVWSSHSVEHLFIFELRAALAEFCRVLRPDGFALITCPDVEAVAEAIVAHGIDHVAYIAPAGPITLHDMLFGHTPSIEQGSTAMAHRTGLTAARLGQLALEAGFPEATVGRGPNLDLWAVLRMPDVDSQQVTALLAESEAAFLFRDKSDQRQAAFS